MPTNQLDVFQLQFGVVIEPKDATPHSRGVLPSDLRERTFHVIKERERAFA